MAATWEEQAPRQGRHEPLPAECFEALARRLRLDVLDMVRSAESGHVDSSFSAIEILATLYFDLLRLDPGQPDWELRDRLVLSKGHAAPALYACLARRGYFDLAELGTLRRLGSRLQGHPKPPLPGVEAATGSLGQGLSLAVGMAVAARLGRAVPAWRTVAVLSDGELDEGQTWEAVTLAGHLRLASLTAIVDLNGLQYTGPTRDALGLGDLPAAFASFGWDCERVDGHSYAELRAALEGEGERPKAVLAHTVKGKGVSFMEDDLGWHGRAPSAEEHAKAREELR